MKDRIHIVYESLQQSLTRIKEHLAWMALFETEKHHGGKFAWSSLEHVEEELANEIGVFQHRFQEMRDLVNKQRGKARKRWERDLEKIEKKFQRLVLQSNGHVAAPKSL